MTATYVTHGVCSDAKCLYAVGPDCECACLGESHGVGYAQDAATSRINVSAVQVAVDEARRAARVAALVAAARFAARQAVKAAGPARDGKGRFVKAA